MDVNYQFRCGVSIFFDPVAVSRKKDLVRAYRIWKRLWLLLMKKLDAYFREYYETGNIMTSCRVGFAVRTMKEDRSIKIKKA